MPVLETVVEGERREDVDHRYNGCDYQECCHNPTSQYPNSSGLAKKHQPIILNYTPQWVTGGGYS